MLRLLPMDAALLDALESAHSFDELYDAQVGDQLAAARTAVKQTLDFEDRIGAAPPWSGYLSLLAADGRVAGSGGFKGGPGAGRTVEIAYQTFPGLEGQGCATALARALCEIAAEAPEVDTVIAHTLPVRSASTAILAALGFSFAGAVTDPEDGRVWLWELPLAPAPTATSTDPND